MKGKTTISDEKLASILRAISITGICPTREERAYLNEAADRLEVTDIERLAKKLGIKLEEGRVK